MNVFHHDGFIGSIEIDPVHDHLYGKLLYINDLVTYEADTVAKLKSEFKKAIKEYLATCDELNREPMKPFKGSLNIRIGSKLHKEAALHATMHGISLNDYIKVAVQKQIHKEQ